MCHSGWACGIGRRRSTSSPPAFAQGRPRGHAGEERNVRRAIREGRGHVPRRARTRVRKLGRYREDARPRATSLSSPAHAAAACDRARDLGRTRVPCRSSYQAGGHERVRAGTLQRLFRDMHAGTQHVVASPPVFRTIGRELAGLAKGRPGNSSRSSTRRRPDPAGGATRRGARRPGSRAPRARLGCRPLPRRSTPSPLSSQPTVPA